MESSCVPPLAFANSLIYSQGGYINLLEALWSSERIKPISMSSEYTSEKIKSYF